MRAEQRAVRVSVVITPHASKRPLDLSPYVTSFARQKSRDGDTVGSWSVGLKMPDPGTRHGEALWRRLMGEVRDDDWGEIVVYDKATGARSRWEILVDSSQMALSVNEEGGIERNWSITGFDWARCMVVSQIRLSAVFQSVFAQYDVDSDIVRDTTFVQPAPMPGFIQTPQWDAIVRAAVEGATGTAGKKKVVAASTGLRRLLTLMLAGMWVDPHGDSLLKKLGAHGWQGFGPVRGVPWQLMHLAAQKFTTPDQLLRSNSCAAYNEVYYGYDKSGAYPAIQFRERPYSPESWRRLPVIDLTRSTVLEASVSRSGAERFTYWQPSTSISALQGRDIVIDTATGRMPIIETRTELARHGVRPAEPDDNYWPPAHAPSPGMLEFLARRIQRYRLWYQQAHEMLTGSVRVLGIYPNLEPGMRVRLAMPWVFRAWDKSSRDWTYRSTPIIEGYVVTVEESGSTNEEGGIVGSTSIQFTRGQPPGGLPVPPAMDWKRGATIKTVTSRVEYQMDEGAYIEVNGQQIAFPKKVKHLDALHVAAPNSYGPRTQSVSRLYLHHSGTGSPMETVNVFVDYDDEPDKRRSVHFEIDPLGQLWQYLDPALHESWGVKDLNANAINIELTGGGKRGLQDVQYETLSLLLDALEPHFPALSDEMWAWRRSGESSAAWATRMGIDLEATPGIFAHQQLSSAQGKIDPSIDGSDSAWKAIAKKLGIVIKGRP